MRRSCSSYRTTCSKLRKIEISVEFAIDSRKQILVKRRRHARRIVVGQHQSGNRLLKVGRQQQRIVFAQNRTHFAQKLLSGGPVEISNRAAQKQDEQFFVSAPPRRYFPQAVQIGAFKSHDAYRVHLAQFLLAAEERAAGNVDRVIIHALPAGQGLEQPARLLAASASQFRNNHGAGHALDNFARVSVQACACPRGQAILRQHADHIEERGTHLVVQILRRKFFLSRVAEPHHHIGTEFR